MSGYRGCQWDYHFLDKLAVSRHRLHSRKSLRQARAYCPGFRSPNQREMGCQLFSKKWHITVLQEHKPRDCLRFDRNSQRSADTLGMFTRVLGMSGYRSHAAYEKDMVGVRPYRLPWEKTIGTDQLGRLQRGILHLVLILPYLKLEGKKISIAEFQVKFLTLERFAPGSFSRKQERITHFVLDLTISIQSVVAPFQV